MVKIAAGKTRPRYALGAKSAPKDEEARVFLNRYYAAKKLAKARKGPAWKLAAAATGNPFMVIGTPQR